MSFWPFKKKPVSLQQLEFQDQALGELAQMFLSYPNDPTPGNETLDAASFDYSVGSLKAMDVHLSCVREMQFDERSWSRFILRAGAYVGEVIRRNTPKPREWHWLDYKQAVAVVPFVETLGKDIGTAAVLWDGNKGVIFPCAKVGKFIENGLEDSVSFYAQVIIAEPPPTA